MAGTNTPGTEKEEDTAQNEQLYTSYVCKEDGIDHIKKKATDYGRKHSLWLVCIILEQLGRILAGIYQCLYLGYHVGAVFGIRHAEPFAGGIEHFHAGGVLYDELVHH